MTIHVIVAKNPDKLSPLINSEYPDANLKIDDNVWLVNANMTAKELSDSIKVSAGENGSAFIAPISAYYGRMPTNVWEWIKLKWEQQP